VEGEPSVVFSYPQTHTCTHTYTHTHTHTHTQGEGEPSVVFSCPREPFRMETHIQIMDAKTEPSIMFSYPLCVCVSIMCVYVCAPHVA